MRSLRVKFSGGSFLKFTLVYVLGLEWTLFFKLGSFQIIVSIFRSEVWKIMGVCRFHVYYKNYYIFHWCDLCIFPRIRGLNL